MTEFLKMSPAEVVDYVEDALARLAVVSEENLSVHNVDEFRHARRQVSLGSGAVAYMTTEGAQCEEEDQTGFMAETLKMGSNFYPFAKELGRRLSYSLIRDVEPGQLVAAHVGSHKEIINSDFEFDPHPGFVAVKGVETAMYSVSIFSAKAVGVPRYKLPIVVMQEALCMRDGRSLSGTGWYPIRPDGLLLCPTLMRPISSIFELKENSLDLHFQTALLEQWAERDVWSVQVALSKNRTGVGLPTNAEGAQALLRALDRSTKSSRRSAIVHWVRDHYRRQRSGDETKVRAHLRGQQNFELGGFHVHVRPAPILLEKAINGARFDETKEPTT